MKVRRIGSLKLYREYESALVSDLVPRYLAKSGCSDTANEILSDIRLGCNNPFFFCCVLLDEGRPVGFLVAYVSTGIRGKRVIIDHLYAPNMGMAGKLYDLVTEKLGIEDVVWMTYRNPESWVRFSNKQHRPMEVFGWMLRRKKEV